MVDSAPSLTGRIGSTPLVPLQRLPEAGAVWTALRVARQAPDGLVVVIVCDRGDRYLSTGVFRG
jgi:cysteine synthase